MRLVLDYGSTIEQAPLQVYSGALVFCPENSKLKRLFWNSRLPFINGVTGVQKKRDYHPQVLEDHGNASVTDVCISPDGETIATASSDSTIKLWNTTTGIMKRCLEGHKYSAKFISFLHGNQWLVSGSHDGTVLVWNTLTANHEEILKSNEGIVSAIACSDGSDTLIAGFSSGTIIMWDPATKTSNRIFQGTVNLVEESLVSSDVKAMVNDATKSLKRAWEAKRQLKKKNISYEEYKTIINGAEIDHFQDFMRKYEISKKKIWSNKVNSLNISPDGQVIACAWKNGAVRLWCAVSSTWEEIYNNKHLRSLALSTDGLTLAMLLGYHSVKTWDIKSKSWKHSIKECRSPISSISFSQGGQSLFLVSGYDVYRWALNTKFHEVVFAKVGNSESINVMKFSAHRGLLLLACKSGKVYIWRANSSASNLLLHDSIENKSTTVPQSRDQTSISSSGVNTRLIENRTFLFAQGCLVSVPVWIMLKYPDKDSNSYFVLVTLAIISLIFEAILLSVPGKLLLMKAKLYVMNKRIIRLEELNLKLLASQFHELGQCEGINPATGARERLSPVRMMAVSPNGRILATVSSRIHLYDTATNTLKVRIEEEYTIDKIRWSPDGKKICSLSMRTAKLYDSYTGACVKIFRKQKRYIDTVDLVYSMDNQVLVCVFSDYTMELWNAVSLTRRRVLRGHKERIWTVSFSADSHMLASASDDCTVRLWDTSSGACKYVIETDHHISKCTWAPDSLALALALDSGKVRLWDIATKAWRHAFDVNTWDSEVIAFSADGHTIALLTNYKSISCWNKASGMCKQTIEAGEPIYNLAFSDNQHLIINQILVKDISSTSLETSHPPIFVKKLYIENVWICYGSQKLIWVPPDYRARSHAVYNSTLALGHSSGSITFLELDI
jgi:WD40 repeat protein